jgi:hypothetical protein
MAKDPSLAAPISAAGRILANGALKVALPLVDGATAVYSVTGRTEWCFRLEALRGPNAHHNGATAVTPGARVKHAIDLALGELADIEKRARAAGQLSNIAAE